MEDKYISWVKKLFEYVHSGITCEVTKMDYKYSMNGFFVDDVVGYQVYIKEPYRLFYDPLEFSPKFRFYDQNDNCIYEFIGGMSEITNVLSAVMTNKNFIVKLNENLIQHDLNDDHFNV